MELNQADQYYLKALDYYPNDFEFVLENLQYALSYDDEHVQSLCLKGQIFMYYLKEYSEARRCFQLALQANMDYPDVYKHLSGLYIWLGEYDRAIKLIRYGKRVPGMNQLTLLRHEALIHEYQGDYKKARLILQRGHLLALSAACREAVKQDVTRLKEKIKSLKQAQKKRRVQK